MELNSASPRIRASPCVVATLPALSEARACSSWIGDFPLEAIAWPFRLIKNTASARQVERRDESIKRSFSFSSSRNTKLGISIRSPQSVLRETPLIAHRKAFPCNRAHRAVFWSTLTEQVKHL